MPSERRIPKIRILTRQGEALLSKRIIVSIDSWPRDSKYPQVYALLLGFYDKFLFQYASLYFNFYAYLCNIYLFFKSLS